MKRFLMLAALLMAFSVSAAPPYDVTATVTAPTTGGTVDRYELRMDGVPVRDVVPGANTFPGLITADGTYVFTVAAINAAGETLSDPVTVTVSEIALPGKPGVTIQVDCSPCVIDISP